MSGFDVDSDASGQRLVGVTMIYLVLGGMTIVAFGAMMLGRSLRQWIHLRSARWQQATLEAAKLPVKRFDRRRQSPMSTFLILLQLSDASQEEVVRLYPILPPGIARSGLTDADEVEVAFHHRSTRHYAVVRAPGGRQLVSAFRPYVASQHRRWPRTVRRVPLPPDPPLG